MLYAYKDKKEITLKLIIDFADSKNENLEIKYKYIVFTGDGRNEIRILKELCNRFNGLNKIIWFPGKPIKKETGLGALKAVRIFPSLGYGSMLFMVDGEHIIKDAESEIQNKLKTFGVRVDEITRIQDAFFIKCGFSNYNINLFCVISGPKICIEEEIAKLIKFELNIEINIIRSCKLIMREIKDVLREKNLDLEQLLINSKTTNLTKSFSNICAILSIFEKEC
jgi:hypothetical protein